MSITFTTNPTTGWREATRNSAYDSWTHKIYTNPRFQEFLEESFGSIPLETELTITFDNGIDSPSLTVQKHGDLTSYTLNFDDADDALQQLITESPNRNRSSFQNAQTTTSTASERPAREASQSTDSAAAIAKVVGDAMNQAFQTFMNQGHVPIATPIAAPLQPAAHVEPVAAIPLAPAASSAPASMSAPAWLQPSAPPSDEEMPSFQPNFSISSLNLTPPEPVLDPEIANHAAVRQAKMYTETARVAANRAKDKKAKPEEIDLAATEARDAARAAKDLADAQKANVIKTQDALARALQKATTTKTAEAQIKASQTDPAALMASIQAAEYTAQYVDQQIDLLQGQKTTPEIEAAAAIKFTQAANRSAEAAQQLAISAKNAAQQITNTMIRSSALRAATAASQKAGNALQAAQTADRYVPGAHEAANAFRRSEEELIKASNRAHQYAAESQRLEGIRNQLLQRHQMLRMQRPTQQIQQQIQETVESIRQATEESQTLAVLAQREMQTAQTAKNRAEEARARSTMVLSQVIHHAAQAALATMKTVEIARQTMPSAAVQLGVSATQEAADQLIAQLEEQKQIAKAVEKEAAIAEAAAKQAEAAQKASQGMASKLLNYASSYLPNYLRR